MEDENEIIDFVECFFNFYPYKYQQDFLKECCKNKRVVGVWCRQSGKSTSVSAYAVYKCLTESNYTFLIFAPTQKQSSELYSKIRNLVSNSKIFARFIKISTQTEMVFENGSRILSLPVGPNGDTIRGFTGKTVVLEEAEGIKDSIVNEVIMPMIASTDGQIIKIGTGKGKNHFWESAHGSETQYKLFDYDWTFPVACGQITKEFIEEQRKNLTEMEFATEYEAKFIEDADCYFKYEVIQNCIEEYNLPEAKIPKHDYGLGVDIAGEGEDESVFISLLSCGGEFRVVDISNYEKNKPREVVGKCVELDEKYGYNKILLDKTGMGSGPSDWLAESLGGDGHDDYRVDALVFTLQSKMDIYSNLKKLMEQGKIKFPNHRKLVYQLLDLRYELTSSGGMKLHHSERGHDDYPDALALACWACKDEGNYRPMLA
jgi:hypothetical protein